VDPEPVHIYAPTVQPVPLPVSTEDAMAITDQRRKDAEVVEPQAIREWRATERARQQANRKNGR
jgi:hypothetical protein